MTLKRAIDLAVAVPALAVAGPVILGLAAAVRLSSPGPAFFRQQRRGKDGAPIRVLKLRTMVDGAERLGSLVTASRDPRVTPLGALLRATKLDELPQLWNVVRGDMSLVGPRPEAEHYARRYRPEWQRLFSVHPGITDPASLAFRDEEALLAHAADRERAYFEAVLPAKIAVALEGIDRASVSHDLAVLLRTAAAVLRLGPRAPHPAVEEARRAIEALNRKTREIA